MDFTQIKEKRRRSVENQLFESPDPSATKRPRQPPSTPSTTDSRTSLLFEASASSKSLDSKNTRNSVNSGRRRSLSNKEGGSSVSQSRLFQNEATESTFETATLLPSSQETREASSRLFQSPEKPTHQKDTGKGRSSFFGAVMSNVHQWKSGEPSTPQTSGFRNIAAASPGGFNLMNFVNSVTSPFHPKRNAKAAPSTPMTPGTPSTPRYGPTTPRHEREWHQATLSRSGEVKWIDWTLKSKLDVECSPGHSLHKCSALTQQKACMRFIAPMQRTPKPQDPQQEIEEASVQWQEALLYWQYPATIQNHAPYEGEASSARKTSSSLSQSKMGMTRSNSMPPIVFTKAAQKRASGANLMSVHPPHEKEWQDAFSSLYASWMERVKLLCEKRTDMETDAFAEEVAAAYFYAQRTEHTVLFRIGTSTGSSKLVKNAALVPEIVISSSTPNQRDNLSSLGVTWRLLERYSKSNNVFGGHPVEPIAKEDIEKGSISCGLDEDLVALRRAQVCGKTVGADVSISVTSRKSSSKLSSTPKLVSPLFLSGVDDCEKFYQLYISTVGKLTSDEIVKEDPKIKTQSSSLSPDVPILLCRTLGPFLNASLKRLEVQYTNLESGHGSDDHYDAAEASGIILPCAVRRLIHAAIHSVEFTTRSPILNENSRDSSESIVGTNHLIAQLSLQGNSYNRKDSRKDGSSCSSFFNANSFLWDSISDKESYEICHFQESVETAVWDVNRPQDVAYKLSKVWDFM